MQPITAYIKKHTKRTDAAVELKIDLMKLRRFELLDAYVHENGEIYLPRRIRGVNRIKAKMESE